MNLDELKSKGGFVPLAPVEKEVTWTRKNEAGEEVSDTFKIYIKRHSFGAIESIWSGDGDRSKSAAYISQSVKLGLAGKESLTYEGAYQLDPGLATVFINAINEVNGTGKTTPKN